MINPKHMEGKEIRLIFFPGFIHTYNAPTRFFTKEKTPRLTSGDDDLFQSHTRIKPRGLLGEEACSQSRLSKNADSLWGVLVRIFGLPLKDDDGNERVVRAPRRVVVVVDAEEARTREACEENIDGLYDGESIDGRPAHGAHDQRRAVRTTAHLDDATGWTVHESVPRFVQKTHDVSRAFGNGGFVRGDFFATIRGV